MSLIIPKELADHLRKLPEERRGYLIVTRPSNDLDDTVLHFEDLGSAGQLFENLTIAELQMFQSLMHEPEKRAIPFISTAYEGISSSMNDASRGDSYFHDFVTRNSTTLQYFKQLKVGTMNRYEQERIVEQ